MLRKPNRGKEKGSDFEREFCKQLSLWFTKGKDAKAFWRAPSSGAMATQNKDKTNEHFNPGDVIGCSEEAVALMEHMVIELKRGYDYDLSDLITMHKKSSPLIGFVKQLEREMNQHRCKFGFLVLKQDRKPAIVMIPRSTYEELWKSNAIPARAVACFITGDSAFFAVSLASFFEFVDPVFFKSFVSRKNP